MQYRKRRGISIGKPPFGAVRGTGGYLEPSPHGAWLLPNGRFAEGKREECPEQGAIWRGYYDCAQLILTPYAEGNQGMENDAYRLNDEGWAFCDRSGKPRRSTRDDVRRVVANWPE